MVAPACPNRHDRRHSRRTRGHDPRACGGRQSRRLAHRVRGLRRNDPNLGPRVAGHRADAERRRTARHHTGVQSGRSVADRRIRAAAGGAGGGQQCPPVGPRLGPRTLGVRRSRGHRLVRRVQPGRLAHRLGFHGRGRPGDGRGGGRDSRLGRPLGPACRHTCRARRDSKHRGRPRWHPHRIGLE